MHNTLRCDKLSAMKELPLPKNLQALCRVQTYQGHVLDQTYAFDENHQGLTPEGVWTVNIETTPQPMGFEAKFTFTLKEGRAQNTALAIGVEVSDWHKEVFTLLPAAAYNGNRFRCDPQPYPPMFRDEKDHRLDLPVTITNVPHLTQEPGNSALMQTSGDTATPAIGCFNPKTGQSFWLLTQQETRLGNNGLLVQENENKSSAQILITAPAVRHTPEVRRYWGEDDRGASFEAGDTLTLELRFLENKHPSVQGLYDDFFPVRKSLSGPSVYNHELPFGAAFEIHEDKYNRENWNPDQKYYSVGKGPEVFQMGWVGGCICTLPLLTEGDEQSINRVLENLQTVFDHGISPSGYFYGITYGNGTWFGDGFRPKGQIVPHPKNMTMVRKSADGLYFLIKHLLALEDRAPERIQPLWREKLKAVAEAFCKTQNEQNQWGQFINTQTGEVVVGGSTAGALAPAALALAARYFKEPKFLEAAIKGAKHYVTHDLQTGVTTGGPGEILQCPDSESAFALLESLVILHEETNDPFWLGAAKDAAAQCATWVVSYDYRYPPQSTFGKLDLKATGSVVANVQNKHSAPGICTFSGDSLFKLFRATGNPLYAELIKDIAHNITQYMSRKDKPIGPLQPGWINERVNTADWEGPENVGEVFAGPTWAEVSSMLTYIEIPSVYAQTQGDVFWVFDHLEASWENQDQGLLAVHNPTAFETTYRFLIEHPDDQTTPLGISTVWEAPQIHLAAGASARLRVSPGKAEKL